MGLLADIQSALDRWPEWKKLRAAAVKVEELERRLIALEERLQRAPGEACQSCGALAFRVEKSEASENPHLAEMGMRDYHWKCKECGYTDLRTK